MGVWQWVQGKAAVAVEGMVIDPAARVLACCWRLLEDQPRKRLLERLASTLRSTESYLVWWRCARQLDRLNGYEDWRSQDASPDYDHGDLRERVNRLKETRLRHIKATTTLQQQQQEEEEEDQDSSSSSSSNNKDDSIQGLMIELRNNLHRHICGISNVGLGQDYLTGTKRLVDEYFEEVQLALGCVLTTDQLTLAAKYDFFKASSQAYGHTALLLSGGAAFGLHHIGVVKALWEAKLLPRVITGSSAGSIVGAYFCCKSDREINELFRLAQDGIGNIKLNMDAFDSFDTQKAIRKMLWRLLCDGTLMNVARLQRCLQENCGDLTFKEAYEISGRVLNVTVCSTREKNTALVLNYLTSPSVVVWSAVCASCALPGVFEPVELLMKTATGEIVPSCPSRQTYMDGSVNMDLPIKRIAELFNINCLVVSQTNPHVIPFLRHTTTTTSSSKSKQQGEWVNRTCSAVYHGVLSELKHDFILLCDLGLIPSRAQVLRNLMEQRYEGDVTIFPLVSVSEYLGLLQNPPRDYLDHCVVQSQRRTWPKLGSIRRHLGVEPLLDSCLSAVMMAMMESFHSLQMLQVQMQMQMQMQVETQQEEEEEEEEGVDGDGGGCSCCLFMGDRLVPPHRHSSHSHRHPCHYAAAARAGGFEMVVPGDTDDSCCSTIGSPPMLPADASTSFFGDLLPPAAEEQEARDHRTIQRKKSLRREAKYVIEQLHYLHLPSESFEDLSAMDGTQLGGGLHSAASSWLTLRGELPRVVASGCGAAGGVGAGGGSKRTTATTRSDRHNVSSVSTDDADNNAVVDGDEDDDDDDDDEPVEIPSPPGEAAL